VFLTCEHVSLVENLLIIIQKMEISMSGLNAVKGWVGAMTDLGLMLLGLAIRAATDTDFGAILFVFKLGEAVFPHQIDDRLNLFNIHMKAILVAQMT